MANKYNFEDINISGATPTPGPAPLAAPNDMQELSLKDRLVATLIFDTQPKRRAAYMDRIGFELNPKNDNLVKPKGAPDSAYFPIDPGGLFDFNQYFKKGGGSEFTKDIAEGVMDLLQGTATEASGDVGATAAALSGVGLPAVPVARAAGRVAMYNAIEKYKDNIGDMFLDKEIPVDYALRATQSAIQSVAPEAIAAGAKGIGKGLAKAFEYTSKGVRNLLSIGDGTINNQAWEFLKKNPQALANREALQSAGTDIDSTVERLIGGQNKSTADFNSSIFAEKMSPIEALRKQEAEKLDSKVQLDLNKFIKGLDEAKLKLSSPVYKSTERQDGIQWIDQAKKQIQSRIEDMTGGLPSQPGQTITIPFSQADEMVREMQNDLYSKRLLTKDWRNAVKEVVDGPNGLNTQLKGIATQLGSPYAQLKQKESQMFSAFENAANNVDTRKARAFIFGDDLTNPKGTNTDTIARNFRTAVEDASNVLGVDMATPLKNGQILNNIFTNIEKTGPRGSGGALAAGSALGGTAYGLSTLAGVEPDLAKLAGVTGFTAGTSLAQPKIGLPVAVGAERINQALSSGVDKLSGLVPSAVPGALGNESATVMNDKVGQRPQPQQTPSPHNFDDIDLTQ